ncbi:MAG: NifB/NifX family molybdenum-iron cluster-binding protein [Accumulibacter sp.]|uniref:NifB/NifX family molybdenum-iron cluster-binding protein n=1 Tax=Accumulibacter sp. TaxID=2053492 RepID=UPI0033158ECA
MQIAVTSQNRKNITEHAGSCRKFWVFNIERGAVVDKQLLELPIEQSLHAMHHALPAPLAGINVLISGGMGAGLYQRLVQNGISPIITSDTEPDHAIAAFLSNTLEHLPAPDACHDHAHPCEGPSFPTALA